MEPNTGTPQQTTGQTPAPVTSPPPAPAPAPASTPSVPAGGVGVTPGAGTANPSPVATPTNPTAAGQTQQLPAEVQAQLQAYQQLRADYEQLNQHRHLIPIGLDAFRRAQQPAANPAQPQAPAHPWGLPQFDRRLLDFVAKDADGRLTLLPGAPPDALLRVQEYQQKLQQAQTEFYTDPQKALAPIFEKMFAERFEKQFGEKYGQIEQRQQSESIIASIKDWAYAKDAQGNPVTQFNPATGQYEPALSPYGQAYSQFVAQATQLGINTPAGRHQYAQTALTNLLYQQQFKAQQGQQQGQQQAQQFVTQAAQQTAGQALLNNAANAVPAPATAPMSLKDRLRAAMAGVSDEQVRQTAGHAA